MITRRHASQRETSGRTGASSARRRSGRWRRLDRFETNFVDLGGDGGLLGQTGGRAAAAVVAWLDARGEDWKAAVRIVAMDPCATYRRAVQDALPQARI